MAACQSEVTKSQRSNKSKLPENVFINILTKCQWISDFFTSVQRDFHALKNMVLQAKIHAHLTTGRPYER